jgi:hypothetical protein
VRIDAQIASIRAAQGGRDIERALLEQPFVGPPLPTSSPGVNQTKRLMLANGRQAFHKAFGGVDVANALAYGQTDETPPLHEAAAWRLAVALGPPYANMVSPCVLREYDGHDGALVLGAGGWPRDPAPLSSPLWCFPAAFFDCLIAQQDRHEGNWRWDGERLTLIDHGYAFARAGDPVNYSEFVRARHARGGAALLAAERTAVDRLLADPELLGMRRYLEAPRADALAARARTMLARDEILAVGEF